MFSLGFTASDVRRVVWTLIEAALGVVGATIVGWLNGNVWDWRALGVGVIAAAVAVVKNFLLSDSSRLK